MHRPISGPNLNTALKFTLQYTPVHTCGALQSLWCDKQGQVAVVTTIVTDGHDRSSLSHQMQ